jgi:hypothetical protein
MKTNMLVSVAALAALAFPAAAVAAKPTKTDKENAAKECKAERGTTDATREAFRAKYKNLGHCVSKKAREEAAERKAARTNAAKECQGERSDPNFAAGHDGKTFEQFYGKNKNGKNAYGKCVSAKAREKKAEMDAEDERKATELPSHTRE